jgi:hypothetical protein
MPKPTLSEVASAVLDPFLSDNFTLNFASVPGGANAIPLLMQCQSAPKPGKTVAAVEVQLFGYTFEHAGNATFGHSLSVTYVENRQLQIIKILEDWNTFCRNPLTQTGNYKADYTRNGILTLYDQTGAAVSEYSIFNCWPTEVPELSLDGTSSNVITVGSTFQYDYWVRNF